MNSSSIESSLKRFLKRKIKITMGVVVAFLITGTVGYSGGNGSIVSSVEIENDKTINLTEKTETGERYAGIINNAEDEMVVNIETEKNWL